MNVSDYTYLLNHPETINEKRTDELDKIVAEFPYFQSARALRLKGLYNEDSFRYNYALKVTAAFTGDRSVLFDFITSDSFTSVEKELFAKRQQELRAIEVAAEVAEIPEMTVDESLRASLDTEFVRADETMPELPEAEFPDADSDPETASSGETDILESDSEDFGERGTNLEIEDEPEFSQDEPQTDEPEYDAATRSVLDSIKEAEQYAKSLLVTDVEEVQPEPAEALEPEVTAATEAFHVTQAEQNLEVGKPLEFSSAETHSFHEWLQLSSFKPINRDEALPSVSQDEPTKPTLDNAEDDSGRQKKNELIDKFIESNPKIPKITPDSKAQSFIFEPSQADNSYLMTETLARVYLEQKKYEKAIQAYEILILKYPEKSSFFADRILDIKSLQQNNKL